MLENELLKKDLVEDELALLDREMDRLRKEISIAYLLWFFLGIFGVHKFYLNRPGMGVVYILTFGFLGLGWLYDLFTLPQQVNDANSRIENSIIHQLLAYRKRRAASADKSPAAE